MKKPQEGDLNMAEEKKQEPAEPEIEGGGWNWWYVCPDCHGAIDPGEEKCRHCGREIKWIKPV